MMPDNPLQSLANYSRFVAEMLHRPTVVRSTVVVWPASPYTGMAEGDKHVPPDIKHHRIPAPDISFTRPNLPVLLQEIEALILA